MCSRGMLVHCSSCLSAAATVLAAKIPCGDGVFTTLALERAKAVHHFDGVMSHSINCSPSSLYDPELKTTPRHERNGRRLALMIGSKSERISGGFESGRTGSDPLSEDDVVQPSNESRRTAPPRAVSHRPHRSQRGSGGGSVKVFSPYLLSDFKRVSDPASVQYCTSVDECAVLAHLPPSKVLHIYPFCDGNSIGGSIARR